MGSLKRFQNNIAIYAVLFIFVINLIFIVTVHSKWNTAMGKYIPLKEHVETARTALATGHLWLEEAISGDKNIDYKRDVYPYFEGVLVKNRQFQQTFSKQFETPEEQQLMARTASFDSEFEAIHTEVQKRWSDPEHAIGSVLDEAFDRMFNQLQEKLNDFSSEINTFIYRELDKRNYYFIQILLLFLSMNIAAFSVLFYFRRVNKKLFETLEHTNSILGVIRNVNQTIVKTKDQTLLLKRMVAVLTTNRHIFNTAWIALYDDDGLFSEVVGSHVSEEFSAFKSQLLNTSLPYCIANIGSKKLLVIEDASKLCGSCALKNFYPDDAAIVIRLEHEGRTFGVMGVSMQKAYLHHQADHDLLLEAAGDIAFALYSLEIESQLILNEKKFENIFEHNKSAIAIYRSEDGERFVFSGFNKTAEKLEQVKREELIGREVREVFPDAEVLGLLDVFKRVYRSGRAEEHPASLYQDEKIVSYRENYVYKLNDHEVITFYLDKTAEKQYEKALKISEERLEYAIEGTNDGLWDWNLEANTLYFSPRWKAMLGYKDDELPNTYQSWADRVHPDDIEKIKKDIAINHQTPGVLFENIHRLRHKDGHWVWILDRGQTIFDENGKAVRMVGFHTDISEQKNLENELRASKLQFELFMDNLPYAVVIKDESTKIIYANKNVQKYLTQDIIGHTSIENLGNAIGLELDALIKKATKDGKAEKIMQGKLYGKNYIARVLAFRIPQNNGKIYTGLIYVDITQEYTAEDEIRKLKSALDRSPVSIMMTDIDGNIEYVNPHYTKVSGYSLKELIGKNPRIVKSGSTSDEKYAEMWNQISHGHVWTADIKNIAKDGSEFWEDSTIIPSLNESGEVDGYIAFKLEITEKVYLQEELKNKEEIMIAQSRHAAMGEMIGMIAHQWRQPITVIAMGANNLLVDIDLHEVSEENIKEESQSILKQKTIDDFKNFFRPDKEIEEVRLEEVMNEAEKIIGKSLEHEKVALSIKHENGYKVKTYSRELLQVYINLLKNAKEVLVEHREKDRHIDVVISDDAEYVITTICDNGGGIDKTIMDKIFDPYFTTKDEKTGTGLGLYMSKTIIEKHLHGTIEVYNTEDGACFKIAIPMEGGGSRQ